MSGSIVVGVEGSQRSDDALALARVLAQLAHAELVLVNAYPYDQPPGGPPNPEYEQYVRTRSAALLDGYAEALADLRPRLVSVASVSPARALHEAAEQEHAAVLVVGPTHRASRGHVATGSVADRLLAGAPCPVAAAPAGYAGADRRPLGAAGPIGVAFVNTAGGRVALEAAAALARRAGAPLEVLAVADPSVVAPDAWAGRAGLDELKAAQRDTLQRAADAALAALDAPADATVRILTGAPTDVLAGESARLGALVCGSRDYGPATSVLVGGVSKHVMHHARCPVLVVPRRSEVPFFRAMSGA